MTKIQKIKWGVIISGVVGVMTIYNFLPPAVQVATKADTEALRAEIEPIECDTLVNTIKRLRGDKREYRRDLRDDPDDDFAQEEIEDLEREIKEKEAKRIALGCG